MLKEDDGRSDLRSSLRQNLEPSAACVASAGFKGFLLDDFASGAAGGGRVGGAGYVGCSDGEIKSEYVSKKGSARTLAEGVGNNGNDDKWHIVQ